MAWLGVAGAMPSLLLRCLHLARFGSMLKAKFLPSENFYS